MLSPKWSFYAERLGLACLGLLLPLSFLPSLEDAYLLPQLFALGLAVLLLGGGGRPLLAGRRDPGLWLGLFYFAWRLCSALWNHSPLAALLQDLDFAFLFLWARAALGDPHIGARLRFFMLAGALLGSLYALAQSFGLDPLQAFRGETGFGERSFSTLGNPDFWGAYLLLLLPLAWERPWLAALLTLSLVLSQTRAAYLAALITFGVWIWKGPRQKIWPALGAGLLAFLIFSFPNPLNPQELHSLQRLTALGQQGNQDLSGRRVMARVGLKLVAAKPIFGFGPGALAPAFVAGQGELFKDPAYAAEPYRYTADLHQDFLQVAAESGLPAFLAFVTLFFWSLIRAWQTRRFAILAALVSLGADACFHFPLEVVPSAALFWVFLAWAEAPAQRPETPVSRAERLLPPLVALLSLLVFGRLIHASALLHQGMDMSLGGESAAATPLLEASLAIHDDERAWMRLGLDRDALGDENGASNAFCRCEDIPEGLANEALAQAKLGHLEQGRDLSRRSLALNPKNLEAWGNLGKINYLLGLSPTAEADYRQGLALDPSWAAGYFNLAAMEINEKRPAAAKLDLQNFLRLQPGDAQATALLRRLP